MVRLTTKQYKEILKGLGVSYLGNYSQSAKLVLNERVGNVITYNLYLAPWTLAGVVNGRQINTCLGGEHCHESCLFGSGRSKIEGITYGVEHSLIMQSRIKKTRLFYTDRDLFMSLLCYELEHTKAFAEKKGFGFSVRLNCTSDISPLAFKANGKNILEMYPNVVFYDYTKVIGRLSLPFRYPNYHLTWSFDGYNHDNCLKALAMGINVAVVFDTPYCPKSFMGYNVINGTLSDLRYKDEKGGNIVYLEYHRTANDYKTGKYVAPNTPFVVKGDNPNIYY